VVAQGEKRVRAVHLVSADAIEPVETEYIVRPYIPRGEATWLEGVTKTGKTMVALDIIARITTGRPFVNGEPIEMGNVAIITCEDDPARTLVPRLIAAGADRARVSFVQVREGDEQRHIAFLADLHAIEERLGAANVSLVFVDGTFGVLGVKDATSYTEAYDTMLPFVAMVRRLNVGALIVRHVRKSAGSALDKGIGSVGFGALARSTLAVAIDSEDDARRIFAHAGCNVGPTGASYAFTIVEAAIEGFAYPVARAAWGERVEISADEAVAPRSVDESGARSEAEEFLLAFLDGPRAASEVQAEAKKRGLSFRTVQRTARRLGVVFERRGFGEGSLWIPPEQPIRDENPHSRHDKTPVANGANVSRMGELSDHGVVCRCCKTLDLAYDMGDGTWLCKTCSEAA
jgi:putative DNA primase/helicase